MRGGWIPEAVLPERLRARAMPDRLQGRAMPDRLEGSAMPDRLRGSRWSLSPRHVLVVALVLAIGLLWAGCSVLRSRPEVVPDARPSAGIVSGSPVAAPSSSPTSSPAAPATLVVHVAGKVRRPGLVRIKAGSRVADVVTAAGGALPGVDLSGLNLARQVTDGEQIIVGQPGAQPGLPPPAPATPGASSPTSPVDLNTATLAQLENLPGVGPVLAQRIIDYRTEHGRFTSIDELQEVSGVGEKKFESLKPHVRV